MELYWTNEQHSLKRNYFSLYFDEDGLNQYLTFDCNYESHNI